MAIMRCVHIEPNREMTVAEFKAWLRRYDEDHDGRISQEELKQALNGLNVWFGWWKAGQVMKIADSNHNGHIEKHEETTKLVTYAQQNLHLKIYDFAW